MGDTSIQWCDKTWNPVVGCNQVSPGCDHCYAKALHDKRHKAVLAGKKLAPQYAEPFEVVQLKPERLGDPLSWRKPRRVFVNSVSDLFHKDVPDEFLDRVFNVMAQARRHTFQILTKRAGRMRSYMSDPATPQRVVNAGAWIPQGIAWPLPNVWLGVSVENNAATSRIGALRQTPAAIRFISFEPLLEGIGPDLSGIDWAIIGGESGPGARPFDIEWARSLVRRCRGYGVAPFVKQLGSVPMIGEDEWRSGDRSRVRLLSAANKDRVPEGFVPIKCYDKHGGDPAEWPEDLRVREMPAHSTPQGAVTK